LSTIIVPNVPMELTVQILQQRQLLRLLAEKLRIPSGIKEEVGEEVLVVEHMKIGKKKQVEILVQELMIKEGQITPEFPELAEEGELIGQIAELLFLSQHIQILPETVQVTRQEFHLM